MKLFAHNGKGTGKLGGSVYVINHGVQIEREYNGTISNPSTAPQVSQRSRFKLASQVSAALAPVIAIPRKGIQSPRNLFVKRNIGYFYGGPDGAQVTYENLQITQGCIGLPGFRAARELEGKITLTMQDSVLASCDHVIYSMFKKTSEDQLQLMNSVVVPVDDTNAEAIIDIDDVAGNLVFYAYGIRLKNARAHATYGNYQVQTGVDFAKLIANRTIEMSDVQFTQTRGTSLGQGDEESITPGADEVIIYIGTNGDGRVNAKINSGEEEPVTNGYVRAEIGDLVTLKEIAGDGYYFRGWYNNGEQTPFATTSQISFEATAMRDIIALWNKTGGLE